MRAVRVFAVLCTLLLCALLLCSCAGEEIDTLAMVTGVAFDKRANGVEMTCCVLKANGKFGAEGEGGENTLVVSALGDSPAQAEERLALKLERRPFFGHDDIIVVSKDAPLESILYRFYEGRGKRGAQNVIITPKNAAAAMSAENFMSTVSAVSLSEALREYEKSADVFPVTAHDIIFAMSAGEAALVPVGSETQNGFEITGMGIIDNYVYLGELTEEQLFGACAALGRTPNTGVTAGNARVYLKDVKTTRKWENEALELVIRCSADAVPAGKSAGDTQKEARQALESAVKAAISAAKAADSDFLELLGEYERATGKKDMSVSNLPIKLNVELTISG